MTCACVAVCACSIWFSLRVRSRVQSDVSALDERMASCERTCADACGAALAVADAVRDIPFLSSNGVPVPVAPTVLGYGQTRSVARRMYYRDVRQPDGTVTREWRQGPYLSDEKKFLEILKYAKENGINLSEI